MHLLYLDASGSADLKDSTTKHYVYLGLSMQEQDWSTLDADLDALKSRYRFPGADFELHVKQFAVSMREQDKIPDFEKLSLEEAVQGDGPLEAHTAEVDPSSREG